MALEKRLDHQTTIRKEKCIFTSMKTLLTVLTLGLGLMGTSSGSDYPPAPSLEEVVEHVYTNYLIDPAQTNQIHFARKPTGWHLQVRPWNDIHRLLDDDQIWSSVTGDWLPLRATYRKRTLDQPTRTEYHLQRYLSQTVWNKVEYDRCIWYGYPEWASDVVSKFADSLELAPIFLESLGRAYGFLADQTLFSSRGVVSTTWQPLAGEIPGNADRLEEYLFFATQSIRTWEALAAQYPGYEMLTGFPETKLSNEKLLIWHHLFFAGQHEEAAAFWHDIIYPRHHQVISRHILESLPENCVFLAYGDNDFFPMLQTQAEGIRQDVMVISNALLNVSWYRAKILDSLNIHLSAEVESSLEKGYLMLPEGDRYVDVQVYGGSQKLRFKPGISGTRKYLLASEVSLIRLIGLSGSDTRPVAFSLGSSYDMLKNVEPYLHTSGPVYLLADRGSSSAPGDPMMMLLGQISSSSWPQLTAWSRDELSLLTEALTASQADKVAAESPLRWLTSTVHQRALAIGADTTGTDDAQQRRDEFVLMYSQLESAFGDADVRSVHHLASLAVSGYQSGMTWLGEVWEQKLYKVLEDFDWESATAQSESSRMARLGLQLLGLHYEESGNEIQAMAIDQMIIRYWNRLRADD